MNINYKWAKTSFFILLLTYILLAMAGCEGSMQDNHIDTPKLDENIAGDNENNNPCYTKGQLEIHHMNVGQADATLVVSPSGKNMLIDTGENPDAEEVIRYLKDNCIESLDVLVITHAHEDHLGGAVAIMSEFPVIRVIDSGIPHTSESYLRYLTYIDEKEIDFVVPVAGDMLELDPLISIRIVNSGVEGDSLNDASVSIHLIYNDFSYLTTGDAEKEGERRIVDDFNVKATVVKVGHHGSDTSSAHFLLQEARPSAAIISYGVGNSYGHPHPEVLTRLASVGTTEIYDTTEGSIVLVSNGYDFEIKGKKYSANQNKQHENQRGIIDINSANKETLQQLPGVGEAIAERIVKYREKNGPFQSIAEIKNVKGIGDAKFEDFKNQIITK